MNGLKLYQQNKYSAEKIEIGGMKFDSKKEARRYGELKMLEDAKIITGLRRQVKYVLIPSQRDEKGKVIERECAYYADFVYFDTEKGETVVEDVKGYRDSNSAAYAKYTIKRKLMLERYGIRIKEV